MLYLQFVLYAVVLVVIGIGLSPGTPEVLRNMLPAVDGLNLVAVAVLLLGTASLESEAKRGRDQHAWTRAVKRFGSIGRWFSLGVIIEMVGVILLYAAYTRYSQSALWGLALLLTIMQRAILDAAHRRYVQARPPNADSDV